MTFEESLAQVRDLLRRQGRVSYRALKRRFDLDDDYLEDLKVELIKAQQLAVDEDGEVLVWIGGGERAHATQDDLAIQVESLGGAPDAERRQLTVMFCDLVDSTRLSGQLDPEEWREVVRIYQTTCADVIQRLEGYVAQYLGDGLLVYFGYPRAHEDDAHRAVRAGLEIVEALGSLNLRLARNQGLRLAVRLGIHTGLVVVGEMGSGGRQEPLALGETPNVAARLQGMAEPDTVVISAATSRLVQGFFRWHDLGTHTLKGVAMPVRVYRVLGESDVQSRLDVAASTGLTPLVGREEEVALLLRRWEQAKAGKGQVTLLTGEAGIGKSRLVQVLQDQVAGDPHVRIEWRCSAYHQQSALHPVIEHLHRLLRWRHDDPQEKLRKLEGALESYGLARPDVVPLLAALLSLPLPERYPPLTLTPQRQRQKTLDALLAWLREETTRQPVLFIVEDLHWVDPSTLELLSLLIDRMSTVRLCTLLTCRPAFHPPWAMAAHLTHLTLSRFAPPHIERMATHIASDRTLPTEVLQELVTKTDGVPLFVEELTKAVLESGLLLEREGLYELRGPLPPLAIPATLHDALMARLDRLAMVKAVAQLGATIGRQFPYELLQAVSPLDDATLRRALERLVEAELASQRGIPPQATYAFKHALIQDAAYQSLLKRTRQHYHQQIAQVLAAQFPDTAEGQPELLAHHYTEAGLGEQAVDYWKRAGQRASEHSAHVEAISHLSKGLEMLTTLPDTPERAQHELTLQLTLGASLMVTKGFGASEVAHAYARARELCQRVGDTEQLFPALRGLSNFHVMRGEIRTGRELNEQLLSLAQRHQDPEQLLVAYRSLGASLFYLGEAASAHARAEQGIALYDPQRHRSLAFVYGFDFGSALLAQDAWALWILGSPDQARARMHDALRLAQELSHPFSLGRALNFAALLHQFRREGRATLERAEAVITLSTEHGFAFWLAWGTILRGWALTQQGQPEEGIARMSQGLIAYRATGGVNASTLILASLAEAHGNMGHTEVGLSVLAETLAVVDQTEERFWEAEIHRLKGELLRSQAIPDEQQAEACFHQALDIARHQQAKSLELRATMSLSRLWQRQGKRDAARQLLAEIYGGFTEGFDTADLQEARALLNALLSGRP